MSYYVRFKVASKECVARNTYSLRLKCLGFAPRVKPGQFFMVWLPSIDEFPLSPSSIDESKGEVRLTFVVRGDGTRALASRAVGDMIFMRGPYGNGFRFTSKSPILIVGGGVGTAPLIPLVKQLSESRRDVHVVVGAKSSSDLVHTDELSRLLGEEKVTVATDDGTAGVKGTSVDASRLLLEKIRFSYVYACGPEPMLFKLHRLLLKLGIPHQMLLERYVKCALGVCGSCLIDGFRLCSDGPVFSSSRLKRMKEFGTFSRTSSGERLPINP